MAHEADYDVDLFAEMARSGITVRRRVHPVDSDKAAQAQSVAEGKRVKSNR